MQEDKATPERTVAAPPHHLVTDQSQPAPLWRVAGKVIGRILSGFVALQYFYWATLALGWAMNLTEWPQVRGDWIFLACAGAGILATERAFPCLLKYRAA